MISDNIIKVLKDRELVTQITNEKGLIKKLSQKPISVYCGFDPTSDSLHLGHLIPLLCLKRFQLAGHKPIILIGGATGLIGDPSFKSIERKLNTNEIVYQWTEKIYKQISLFLDFNNTNNSAVIVNNNDWFGNMKVLNFLRDIGKHFSINQMIRKEIVKQRLKNNTSGISFTEFSYNLLQSFDFCELYNRYKVELQIGGSDQWGNIISGIDLTRRVHKHLVFGLTMPLITKSNGIKFGKTEDNTIWLSPKKTSPYKFYQFWINTADSDVYRFLKFFTFLSLKEIDQLKKINKNTNNILKVQYILAEIVTNIVHGSIKTSSAKRISKNLFSGTLNNMIESDFIQLIQDGIPVIRLVWGIDLRQALVYAKLASSKNQARIMINSNAISINGKKQSNILYVFVNSDRLFHHYTLLKRGNKNYCLIYWI
ncbi:Tyrosine--tRNA ligase [Serratia symbiotica]|nr:Tyrosine--tRNA ligase [Serratia symbiotica]